jgi:hypothetical protein
LRRQQIFGCCKEKLMIELFINQEVVYDTMSTTIENTLSEFCIQCFHLRRQWS